MINEKGETVGFHDGIYFHTLEERHGFTITKKNPNDGPYYIIGKDVNKNILIVSQKEKEKTAFSQVLGSPGPHTPARPFEKQPLSFSIKVKNTNWISEVPNSNKIYKVQIRYHGQFLPCHVICAKSNFAQVIFEEPVLVAAGQSCVLYDGDICLGGGVVQ